MKDYCVSFDSAANRWNCRVFYRDNGESYNYSCPTEAAAHRRGMLECYR